MGWGGSRTNPGYWRTTVGFYFSVIIWLNPMSPMLKMVILSSANKFFLFWIMFLHAVDSSLTLLLYPAWVLGLQECVAPLNCHLLLILVFGWSLSHSCKIPSSEVLTFSESLSLWSRSSPDCNTYRMVLEFLIPAFTAISLNLWTLGLTLLFLFSELNAVHGTWQVIGSGLQL